MKICSLKLVGKIVSIFSLAHLLSIYFSITASAADIVDTLVRVEADGAISAYGEGESRYFARRDAIRNALQFSVEQLILADRLIEDDSIARDAVLSTMNGSIERAEVIEANSLPDGGVGVRMRLKVGKQMIKESIENFASIGFGVTRATKQNLDGDEVAVSLLSAMDELDRQQTQLNLSNQLLDRAFDGYPLHAHETRIDSISIDPSGEYLNVTVGIKLRDTWLESFESKMKVIDQIYPEWNDKILAERSFPICVDSNCFRSPFWYSSTYGALHRHNLNYDERKDRLVKVRMPEPGDSPSTYVFFYGFDDEGLINACQRIWWGKPYTVVMRAALARFGGRVEVNSGWNVGTYRIPAKGFLDKIRGAAASNFSIRVVMSENAHYGARTSRYVENWPDGALPSQSSDDYCKNTVAEVRRSIGK